MLKLQRLDCDTNVMVSRHKIKPSETFSKAQIITLILTGEMEINSKAVNDERPDHQSIPSL